jgi:ABC-type multidrug transport system ATPase subunit
MVANAVPTRYSDEVTQTASPAPAPTPAPLLSAEGVRIDDHGPVLEQLTVATSGTNVAVVGAPRALFEAASGLRDVTAGSLRVAGLDPRDAVRAGALASAPVDAPMPARWKALDFAVENARLAGHGRTESARLAAQALRAMELDPKARTRLADADAAVKRAAMLAGALATQAPVLLVEDFTAGLPDGSARTLARLFVQACAGRRWALFAGRLALSSPLGLEAEEALLFAGGRFVCAGAPAEVAARDRTFSVRTAGAAEAAGAFADKLRERGAHVEADEAGRALTVTMPDDLSTLELVKLARTSDVVVLELLPLSGAVA